MDKNYILAKISPYTMTSVPRKEYLYEAVEETQDLEGDLVEAGVYKGGSSMLMAYALKSFKSNKKIYMYDTFKGMTKPTDKDVKIGRNHCYFKKWRDRNKGSYVDWNYASFEEVRNNMLKTPYPFDNIIMLPGDVSKKLSVIPKKITILRLDVDFYKPTKSLMNQLYPKLVKGGHLIVDDYYCWQGAKDAVDEYFKDIGISKREITKIDKSCVVYIK